MHCQIFLRYVAADRHVIKNVHEKLIDLKIKALQNLISEREGLSHIARLVVTSQHDNVAREILFDCEKKNANLNSEDTTVDVISKEKIVETSRFTSFGYHIKKISVLSMYISNYTDRFLNLN